jgi:hypothetical protein
MRMALPVGGKDAHYAQGSLRELLARRLHIGFIGTDELPGGLQYHTPWTASATTRDYAFRD